MPFEDPEGFTLAELDDIEYRSRLQREGETLVRLECVWCHRRFAYKAWRIRAITNGDAGQAFLDKPLCIDCVHAVAYRAFAQIPIERGARELPPVYEPIHIGG